MSIENMEWGRRLTEAIVRGESERVGALVGEMPPTASLGRRMSGEAADGAEFATPLLLAAWYAHPEACEILLAAGGDPTQRNDFGQGVHPVGCANEDARPEDVERTRALFATCAPDADPPEPYVVLMRTDDGRETNDMLPMMGAADMMQEALGFRIKQRLDQERSGRVWLRRSELAAARDALRRAGDEARGLTFELRPHESVQVEDEDR